MRAEVQDDRKQNDRFDFLGWMESDDVTCRNILVLHMNLIRSWAVSATLRAKVPCLHLRYFDVVFLDIEVRKLNDIAHTTRRLSWVTEFTSRTYCEGMGTREIDFAFWSLAVSWACLWSGRPLAGKMLYFKVFMTRISNILLKPSDGIVVWERFSILRRKSRSVASFDRMSCSQSISTELGC